MVRYISIYSEKKENRVDLNSYGRNRMSKVHLSKSKSDQKNKNIYLCITYMLCVSSLILTKCLIRLDHKTKVLVPTYVESSINNTKLKLIFLWLLSKYSIFSHALTAQTPYPHPSFSLFYLPHPFFFSTHNPFFSSPNVHDLC